MATEKPGKKKVGGVVSDFLAGDKTIKSLTREELSEIDDELDEEHWLKTMVVTELKGRVGG